MVTGQPAARGAGNGGWPERSFGQWRGTRETVHRWTQVVGKVRLGLMPWINHSWHVTLYVSGRGLTTGANETVLFGALEYPALWFHQVVDEMLCSPSAPG